MPKLKKKGGSIQLMKYKVVLDTSKSLFDTLPAIEATSPKDAASKYTQSKVVRKKYNGDIVIETTGWPIKKFIYSRI